MRTALTPNRGPGEPQRGDRGEGGYLTIEMLTAVAASLVLLVVVVNLLVMAYAHGAVRAALDEGARAGARHEQPVAACQTRAQHALEGLVGALSEEIGEVSCTSEGSVIVASIDGELGGWLPLVPTLPVQERASSAQALARDPATEP